MYKAFGSTGVGKTVYTMFGEDPPKFISIEDGFGSTRQVPWGRVAFTPLQAEFNLHGATDNEYGLLFVLAVSAPRKHRQRIEAFFELVERELQQGSLYKGRSINGAGMPGFINSGTVDPEKVIYSDELMTQLDANLWSLITHTDLMRKMRLPLKRHVLFSGSWGTGKTLAGLLTAQEAERHGWTYIQVRSGQDDLFDALKTAQLYAPAVVLFEDIDAVQAESTAEIAELLDRLDNMANKGNEVIAIFTTNHVDQLHKGIMRPGRLDAVIEFGALDRRGYERLVRAVVPEPMLGDIDYDEVAAAMDGMVPAFAREAVDRALRYAIARTGDLPEEITTEDLVAAANGLKPQRDLMDEARESGNPWTIDRAISERIGEELRKHEVEGFGEIVKSQE
jgi:transitional endoplasmic reticulum ATPase